MVRFTSSLLYVTYILYSEEQIKTFSSCVYVCEYVACMYVCVCVYVCVYVCMYYVRVYVYMYVLCVCMYVCVCMCVYVCMYVCMYDTCCCCTQFDLISLIPFLRPSVSPHT